MRVVAGSAGGRLLQAPPGRTTRPTGDRVRESMFNILVSLGLVDDAKVVDLFAGSGALGIEALSRGAAAATFVESDRAAVATIRSNLETLGWTGQSATVVHGDAVAWADRCTGSDLVLADPPYAFDGWSELAGRLRTSRFAGAFLVESSAPVDLGAGWLVVKTRRYGSTVVQLARPAGDVSRSAEPKGGT